MIQANELRIGNWVCNPDDEPGKTFYFKISALANSVVAAEPIPLTPEILEKCGMDEIDESTWAHNEKTFFLCKGSGHPDGSNAGYYLSYYTTGNPMGFNMQYLHQLQNLYFSLTHQELTIKL